MKLDFFFSRRRPVGLISAGLAACLLLLGLPPASSQSGPAPSSSTSTSSSTVPGSGGTTLTTVSASTSTTLGLTPTTSTVVGPVKSTTSVAAKLAPAAAPAAAAPIPSGCSFVATANGTMGVDGWVTSNGQGVAAQLVGTCLIGSLQVEVQSMTYAPSQVSYASGDGLIQAGSTNLTFHRNSQAFNGNAGWGTSYPVLCQGGTASFQTIGATGPPAGQPTSLTASLSFTDGTASVKAAGFTAVRVNAGMPAYFSVTPATPIDFFPVGCWEFGQKAPVGSKIRLVGSTGGGVLTGPLLFGLSAASRILVAGALAELAIDPVNTATGGFDHGHGVVDLAIPGRGENLSFGRLYESRRAESSTLGPAWWHPYFQSVAVSGGSLTWRTAAGSRVTFPPNGSGGFLSPAGVTATASTVTGGGWRIKLSDQGTYSFDSTGKLSGVADRSGQGVTVAYDAASRVSVVTDAAGKTMTFTYGSTAGTAGNGLLQQVATSDGRAVSFGYTLLAGVARLTTFTDARAKVWTYGYDAAGFLATETDPNAKVQFTNTFDAFGRVLTQKDQLNNLSTFSYDDLTETTTLTDASGAVRTWGRGGNLPRSANTPAGSTATSFNALAQPTSFTDAVGKVWSATFDSRGNMLSRTSPAPQAFSESWTYDSFNNPLTFTDARGTTTTYTYDVAGRLKTTSTPSPGGAVLTTYNWNADGTLASVIDPRNKTTSYTYFADGNVKTITAADGGITSYTYDAAGRVAAVMEPRGNLVGAVPANFQQSFTYDNSGNLVTSTDALGRITFNEYDDAGNLKKITTADGLITTYTYNSANELLTRTAPDGGVTTNSYTVRGELASITAPDLGKTTYFYDGAGRVTSMVEPRGNVAGAVAADYTTTYTYYPDGQLFTITDPVGRVSSRTYDPLGRLATIVDPQGTTTFSYDQNGNVLSTAVTGIGTASATFDSLNRMVTSTNPRGKTTSFGYDLGSNVTSVTSPLGFVTQYTYDNVGRQLTAVDPRGTVAGGTPANFTVTTGYDASGNRTTVKNQLNQTTTYAYDRTGKVSSVTDPRGALLSYNYDNGDRIIGAVAPVSGSMTVAQRTTTYGYTAGRLTSMTNPLGRVTSYSNDLAGRRRSLTNPLGRKWTYNYDASGNPTQTVNAFGNTAPTPNPAAGSQTTTLDRLGRPVLTDFSDSTPDIGRAYDSVGRLASTGDGQGSETYGYDAAGRVISVTRGSDVFNYGYDQTSAVTSRRYPDGKVIDYAYDDDGRLSDVRTTAPPPSTSTTLFGDALGIGWANYSWSSTVNLSSTNPVASGLTAVSANVTAANGALSLRNVNPVLLAGGKVTFSLHGGTSGTTLNVYTSADDASQTNSTVVAVTAPANTWVPITLTADQLGNPTLIARIAFQSASITSFSVDNLIVSPGAKPVYSEAIEAGWQDYSWTTTVNPVSTSPVASGAKALSASITTPNGALSLRTATPVALQGGRITFSLHGGTAGTSLGFYSSADDASTINSKTVTVTAAANTWVNVSLSADQLGNPSSVARMAFQSSAVTSFSIDNLSINPGVVARTSYQYDRASNLTATIFPNGTKRAVTVDAAGRTSLIVDTKGSTEFARYTYTRDANGNPTAVVSTGPSVLTPSVLTYDSRNRVTSACYGALPCATASTWAWTYDPNGNITSSTKAGVVTTYTYNLADQLATSTTAGVTSNYTYDLNGNLVSINDGVGVGGPRTAGDIDYTYNSANQTVSATIGTDPAVVYAYDGNSNRASATSSSSTTKFVWDQISGLPDLALERNASNATSRRYVYGLGPISMAWPEETTYYLTDDIGSVTHVTDAVGSIRLLYNYTPFGELRNAVSSGPNVPPNQVKFAGQYQDLSTSNPLAAAYYLRARRYMAGINSFTQTDPMPYGVGSLYEGAYTYGNNSPTVMVDPSGLRSAGRGTECRNNLTAESDKRLRSNGWDWADSAISTVVRGVVNGGRLFTGGFSDGTCAMAEGKYSEAAGSVFTQEFKNLGYVGAATGAAGFAGMTVKQAAARCAAGAAATSALDYVSGGKPTTVGVGVGCLNAGNIKPATKTPKAIPEGSPSQFTRTEALSGRASGRQVTEMAESMKANGWNGPPIKVVEANGKLYVVDGHHRLAAATQAGIKVPYQVVDPSTVIGPGQWSSLDDIIRDAGSVGPNRIRTK